jgi:hypothetical protein
MYILLFIVSGGVLTYNTFVWYGQSHTDEMYALFFIINCLIRFVKHKHAGPDERAFVPRTCAV